MIGRTGHEAAGVSAPTREAPRFVQIPTDTERSSSSGFEVTSSAFVRLDLPEGRRDPARREELLGALLALLHRYTQQTDIALDLFVRDGSGERRIALDFHVASDSPVASVIDEARVALAATATATGTRPPRDLDRRSNVAATFVLAPLELEGTFDAGACVAAAVASYEVHFVLARTHDSDLVAVSYDARLIRSSTAARLLESYAVVLGGALRN